MKFVYPEFLYAFAALAIPVIIHLFNFRKFKKVWFSNVQFLKDIEIQTKARNRLKNLLLLFSRMLAFTFLILAFAQPFISENDQTQKNQRIGIYVDNSFSMENTSGNVSMLQSSVNIAKQIASSFELTDELYLLTNDFESRHSQKLNTESFVRFCNDIDISPTSQYVGDVLNRLTSNANGLDQIFLISDFQSGNFEELSHISDTHSTRITIVPIQNKNVQNLSIDTCWFDFPIRLQDRTEQMHVSITNDGEEDRINVPVSLTINGQVKSQVTTNVPASQTTEIILSYDNTTKGTYLGEVGIEDYPVNFDDKFYFSYSIDSVTNILYLHGNNGNPSMEILFSKDSSVNFSSRFPKDITTEDLTKKDLIILDSVGQLSSGLLNHMSLFVKNGGTVVYIPGSASNRADIDNIKDMFNMDMSIVNDTGMAKIETINFQSFLYSDVFSETPQNMNLPFVRVFLQPANSVLLPFEELMTTINGHSFLNNYSFHDGSVYLFNGSISKPASNFSRHSLFVPTLFNISMYAKLQTPVHSFIGEPIWISTPSTIRSSDVIHIRNDQVDFIPRVKIKGNKMHVFAHDQIQSHGHYQVVSDEKQLEVISLNYNRNESAMRFYASEDLNTYFNELGYQQISTWTPDNIRSVDNSIASILKKEYWSLCIVITLLFLLLESLIIRFWK